MANTFLNKDGLSHLVSKLKTYITSQISAHTSNKSNPHGVTKSQVGLGSVANIDQSKAIKTITRSGTTFTATALDGTKTTFDQQDSNTTYGVATSSANGLMSSGDKSKLDNLKVGGRNLIIKRDLKNGWLSNDTGEIINTDPGYTNTDYIPLKSGETFTISWEKDGGVNNLWCCIYFLNSDKNVIKFYYRQVSGNPFIKTDVAPDQCAYLRVYWQGSKNQKVKIERGTVATDWTPAPEDFQSVTKSFTISASSWSSGSYKISDSLITASSNQELLPAVGITSAQYNALCKAQIVDGGQAAGSLTLKALGTTPTIDIPIRVIFRGTI